MEQRTFFGLSEHLERLSAHGDPLEVLADTVDFEAFLSMASQISPKRGVRPFDRTFYAADFDHS